MLHKRYLQLFCATFLSFCIFDNIHIHISSNTQPSINISNKAYAKRGGGRSRGGSFKSNSSSLGSSSSSSKRSHRSYDYYSTDTIITTNESDLSGNSFPNISNLLILLIIFGGSIAMISRILKSSKTSSDTQELHNEIIAITKLQVALLAENSNIQSQLSELTLNVDTNNRQGRLQLLQESALALLRESENWTHVLASSKTVKSRESASSLFNKYSLQERSKFSAETLSNVEGIVKQQARKVNSQESAGYIVVTLLIGTADDQPLFGEIRTTQALQAALEKIASMREDYLFVVELLWNPQAEAEALTADELLSEYTNMMQIA